MSELTLEELSQAVYEDLNGLIVSVNSDDAGYHVVFECDDWESNRCQRRFKLTFEDVAEATVCPSFSERILIENDHPLLWNHNEEQLDMYFSTAPSGPVELIGELYEAHTALLSGWREMSEFLHADSTLFRGGFGLFASGPRSVVEKYASIAKDRLQFSIVFGHRPKGGYRVALFDSCYVVYRNASVVELQAVE